MILHVSTHANWLVVDELAHKLISDAVSIDTTTKIMEVYERDAQGNIARDARGPKTREVALALARVDTTRKIVWVSVGGSVAHTQLHRAIGKTP